MIAKISKSSNLHGAVIYNFQKIEEEEAAVLLTQNMPLKDEQQKSVIKVFEDRLKINDRTKSPIVHISLNPSPMDIISDEDYAEIARNYMQQMGYGDQPYIVFKHHDIERHHIHIVTTNVDDQGKKINDSNERYRSKEITNEIERKYNLAKSDLSKDNSVWEPKRVDPDKNIGRQISGVVRHLTDQGYKCGSLREFRSLLSLYNINIEEVNGSAKGTEFRGAIYSASNDMGERIGTPIKSSKLAKCARIKYLDEYIRTHQPLRENKKILADKINETIKDSKNIAEFKKSLKNKGVDAIILENEKGRIYGVTWIDHHSKTVVSGSKLDKSLSANSINELFQSWADTQNTNNDQQVSDNIFSENNAAEITSFLEGAIFNNNDSPSAGPRKRKGDDEDEDEKKRRRKRRFKL